MADTLEVTVKFPSDLVQDARELNLLTDSMLTQLLRNAVDQRVNEIVNEEIHDYRREKHTKSTP